MLWDALEPYYAESLSGSGMGAPAKSGRIAYGALLVKERLGLTDEETAEQIQENPYLQYFPGPEEFRDEPLLDPSMMVHFRSRFSQEHHRRINERVIDLATAGKDAQDEPPPEDDPERPYPENGDDQDEPPPSGKLLVDATCAPADVRYPTDLGLLNEAREKTEGVVDAFHAHLLRSEPKRKKERTYRQKARKQFLAVSKQKKPGTRKIRKAVGQQLGYVGRNLRHIDRMLDESPELLSLLSGYKYKSLLVVRELYRQQSRNQPPIVMNLGLVLVGPVSLCRAVVKALQGHCQYAKGNDHDQDQRRQDPASKDTVLAPTLARLAVWVNLLGGGLGFAVEPVATVGAERTVLHLCLALLADQYALRRAWACTL